jgi:hypothetical protein
MLLHPQQQVSFAVLEKNDAGALSSTPKPFNQRDFTRPRSPASFSMAETGYVYVPAACDNGQQKCRVHVVLHGCKQNTATIGDHFYRNAGYNEWADSNAIIVLYPQTVASAFGDGTVPMNPEGCWDWFGFTNGNYAKKSGRQITTIKGMLDKLTSGSKATPAPAPAADRAPRNLRTTDSSDTGVDLVWSPVAGATRYNVFRTMEPSRPFQPIGTVAGPSFGDAALSPARSYWYQVSAVVEGIPSPASDSIAAMTLAVPPRCDNPGTCLLKN